MAEGSYAEALEKLQIAQTFSVTADVFSKMAQVYQLQEKFPQATQAAIKALALEEDNQTAWTVRVASEMARGEYSQVWYLT